MSMMKPAANQMTSTGTTEIMGTHATCYEKQRSLQY